MINLDTYKKNCINKAKPKLACNGKCQVLKKLKEQNESNETNVPTLNINQVEIILSSKSYFPSIDAIKIKNINSFYIYNSSYSSKYIGFIFHPPSV